MFRKADPRVVREAELVKPLRIAEHRALVYGCPRGCKVHEAPVPDTVGKAGLAHRRHAPPVCRYVKPAMSGAKS